MRRLTLLILLAATTPAMATPRMTVTPGDGYSAPAERVGHWRRNKIGILPSVRHLKPIVWKADRTTMQNGLEIPDELVADSPQDYLRMRLLRRLVTKR